MGSDPAARLAYFERLLAGCRDANWRRFYQSQVDYYRQEVGDVAVDTVGRGGHDNQPGGGVGSVAPGPAFRAANERAWAATLDVLNIFWKYEALEPELSRALRYVPDFWLGELRVWLEIKSNPPTPGEIRVARELLQADGNPVYIISGWPYRRSYGVWIFAPAGEAHPVRADWCDLALCGLFDCQFSELWKAFERVRRLS